jgi:formylglycine-generating enzyme required for sulfatase activity
LDNQPADDNNATTWDFFLAHAGPDLKIADDLFGLLAPHARVFLDSRCLMLGDDWDRTLSAAQRAASITVVLISDHTDAAYYEREEIAAAIAMARQVSTKHRIIPVYLDANAQNVNSTPYGLRLKHGITLKQDVTIVTAAERLIDVHNKLRGRQDGAPKLDVAAVKSAVDPTAEASQLLPLTAFLSHGREDKAAVIKLYDELAGAGVKPWLDVKDLVPGQKWRPKTIRAVRECDIVVVCLTRSSISRQGFLHKEIAEALDAADEKPEDTIYVIPLRLEDCDVPERLREWHWVNYHEPDGHANLLRALALRADELGRAKPRRGKSERNPPAPDTARPSANRDVSNDDVRPGARPDAHFPAPNESTVEKFKAEADRIRTDGVESGARANNPFSSGLYSYYGPVYVGGDFVHKGTSDVPEADRLVLTVEDPSASMMDRVAAGRRLAEIGDPRPGVGLRADGLPDIIWCNVPAGAFAFGGDAEAFRGGLRKVVNLPAFRIGKYPVTYRQFQAFIDDPDGYQNAKWWAALHARGLAQHSGGPGEQQFKYENHPREGTSWYDAMAFCRWLSANLGQDVRLPTELQWEKAARGTDGRPYPYGNEYDADKGNTYSSNVMQTSTVGAFPGGASPCGAQDMSGNVWEWSLDEFNSGSTASHGTSYRRVVRGGAWDAHRSYARAAARTDFSPDDRREYVGFRLVATAV